MNLKKCLGPCLPHCSNKTIIIILSVSLAVSVIINLLLYSRIYALSGSQLIPPSQAKRLIKSGDLTQIVDIRTKFEYDAGHYPDSVHLPVNKISGDAVKNAGLDPEKPTLVYCNTGQRARVAANKLEALGFREVYYIEGTYSTIV